MTIFSDAFLSGWGAVCNGITARGPWSAKDAPRHINELELLAELFALQSFTALASNIFISLQMYNSAAVCYVNCCSLLRTEEQAPVRNPCLF
jgi:hypothetical protein